MAERLRTEPGKESVLTHDELHMPETSSCRSPRALEFPHNSVQPLGSIRESKKATSSSTRIGEFLSETCWFHEPEDLGQLLLTWGLS